MSNAESSISSSCVAGITCNSYKLLSCLSGVYAYSEDINHVITYFQEKLCTDLATCHNNAECGASKVCTVNTCCGHGGYCIPLEVGYLTSPAWTASLPEPICKKIKARSISALGGGSGIGIDQLRNALKF
jgi:hypothetical protein